MVKLEEFGSTPRRSRRLMKLSLVETSSLFMSDVNDDLLIEILLHLPHSLSAVRCSLVCKRWSSLIFSDNFRIRFNQRQRHRHRHYLDPSYSLPFTLLFRNMDVKIDDTIFTSRALPGNAPSAGMHHYLGWSTYLDFLPGTWALSWVETASGDLLLSSHICGDGINYCVSNPLTRQWNILPEDMPPLISACTSGLWLDPDQYTSDKRLGNYKVVVLDHGNAFSVAGDKYTFRVLMFCSDSGKWSLRNFTAPRMSTDLAATELLFDDKMGAVVSKGVTYFPLKYHTRITAGFLALDPLRSGDECRIINVPDGFLDYYHRFLLVSPAGMEVVRGRLRLWQVIKSKRRIKLKVWELCDDDETKTLWILMHDVSMKRGSEEIKSVVALDPNDGDVVFIVLNDYISVCKYNIRQDRYQKLGQLPSATWVYHTVTCVLHSSWRLLPIL